MCNNGFSDSLKWREIILNTRKPIILRKFKTNWKCFQESLEKWCAKYDGSNYGEPITFERMPLVAKTPQWERKRQTVEMTVTQFLQEHCSEQQNMELNYWTALNYKRSHDIPEDCRDGVDFSCFGFPRATDDCSYWLSSKGANTPCHADSYGCNIVVQVYGRKSWLLFPPDAPLTSTRIPYEESSIYCLENFYAPNSKQLAEFRKLQGYAFKCVLEPSDVLVVPRHWWHYVETLETSLSINSWIPLEADIETQLEEGIVKCIIETFIRNSSFETQKYILNPNQLQQIVDDAEMFAVLKYLLKATDASAENTSSKKSQEKYAYHYLTDQEVEALISDSPNLAHISQVPQLTNSEFQDMILENAKRFDADSNCTDTTDSPINNIKELLIRSICSPNVIKTIKKEFKERFETEIKSENT